MPEEICYNCEFIRPKEDNSGYVCVESVVNRPHGHVHGCPEELPKELTCERFLLDYEKDTERLDAERQWMRGKK